MSRARRRLRLAALLAAALVGCGEGSPVAAPGDSNSEVGGDTAGSDSLGSDSLGSDSLGSDGAGPDGAEPDAHPNEDRNDDAHEDAADSEVPDAPADGGPDSEDTASTEVVDVTGADGGSDAGFDAGPATDSGTGTDAGTASGTDSDAETQSDAGPDGGLDALADLDAESDATAGSGGDGATGSDAGSPSDVGPEADADDAGDAMDAMPDGGAESEVSDAAQSDDADATEDDTAVDAVVADSAADGQNDTVGIALPPPPALLPALELEGVYEVPPGAWVPLVVRTSGPPRSLQAEVFAGVASLGKFAIRHGRGSMAIQAPLQSGSWPLVVQTDDGPVSLTLQVASRPEKPLTGTLGGADLVWDPSHDIVLSGVTTVPAGATLQIAAGTRVRLGDKARLTVLGKLDAEGSVGAPIWFLPATGAAWGELEVVGSASLSHTWLSGGGGDPTRVFGHSNSQPVVRAGKDAALTMTGGGVVDSPGKAFGSTAATLALDGVLISRCDTGGEHEGSSVTLRNSHVLEIPDADGLANDDDNDGIYLADNAKTAAPSLIEDCVFERGEDDAIDHNGSIITVRRSWLHDFEHEGIAASNGGSVEAEDLVVSECSQGIEAGYGAPQVHVTRCLLHHNGVGLRWGDSYTWEALGTLQVADTQSSDNLLDNVLLWDDQQGAPGVDKIDLTCSRLNEPEWGFVASNEPGALPYSQWGELRWQPLRPAGCGWLGPKFGPLVPPVQAVVLTSPQGNVSFAGSYPAGTVSGLTAQLGSQQVGGVTLDWPAASDQPSLRLQLAGAGSDWFGQGREAQTELALLPVGTDLEGLRSWLSVEVARRSGTPGARHGFAEIWIDGQWLGLYAVREVPDTLWLQRHGYGPAPLYRAVTDTAGWNAADLAYVCCEDTEPSSSAAELAGLLDTAAMPVGPGYADTLTGWLNTPDVLALARVWALAGVAGQLPASSDVLRTDLGFVLLPRAPSSLAWQTPQTAVPLWQPDLVLDGVLAEAAMLDGYKQALAVLLQGPASAAQLAALSDAAALALLPALTLSWQHWLPGNDAAVALSAWQQAVQARHAGLTATLNAAP